MKIDNNNNNLNLNKITQYLKQSQQNENTADKKVQNDKMQISKEAKEIITAKKELAKQPQLRKEKVRAIKAKLDNGTYEVDSKKIAESILKKDE